MHFGLFFICATLTIAPAWSRLADEDFRPVHTVNLAADLSPEQFDFLTIDWRGPNISSTSQYFRILARNNDGSSVILAAANSVYNISLTSSGEQGEILKVHWPPTHEDREMCIMKGKSEDECQNFVRIWLPIKDDGKFKDRYLVCGTNAFKPVCRYYKTPSDDGASLEIFDQYSARGFCPYDPLHNSTALLTDEGHLYVGTVADFSAADSLIIRGRVRTEQYDLSQLNGPQFIGSAEGSDSVFFFVREFASRNDGLSNELGGRQVSSIIRVCKNDMGSASALPKWTTFAKMHVICHTKSESHSQQFSLLHDMARPIAVGDGSIYFLMTTGSAEFGSSAVCRSTLSQVESKFGPCSPSTPPVKPTANVDGEASLLLSLESEVMFVGNGVTERLTAFDLIADSNGLYETFVGVTNHGRIIKIVSSSVGFTTCEAVQLFNPATPVRDVIVSPNGAMITAVTDDQMLSIPLSRCEIRANCSQCLSSYLTSVHVCDPAPLDCSWSPILNLCHPSTWRSNQMHSESIKDATRCPDVSLNMVNIDGRDDSSGGREHREIAQTASDGRELGDQSQIGSTDCPTCICPSGKRQNVSDSSKVVTWSQTYDNPLPLVAHSKDEATEVRLALSPINDMLLDLAPPRQRQSRQMATFNRTDPLTSEANTPANVSSRCAHSSTVIDDGYATHTGLILVLSCLASLCIGLALGYFATHYFTNDFDSKARRNELKCGQHNSAYATQSRSGCHAQASPAYDLNLSGLGEYQQPPKASLRNSRMKVQHPSPTSSFLSSNGATSSTSAASTPDSSTTDDVQTDDRSRTCISAINGDDVLPLPRTEFNVDWHIETGSPLDVRWPEEAVRVDNRHCMDNNSVSPKEYL